MSLSSYPFAAGFFSQEAAAVLTLDSGGRISQASPRLAGLLGQPAAALPGRCLLEFLPLIEKNRVQELIAQAAAGQVLGEESILLGVQRPRKYRLALFPQLADNRITGVYGVIGAAPEAANGTLLAQQQLYSVIFENMNDGTFVVEVEPPERYRFTFANRAFGRTTGLDLPQVIGGYVDEVLPEPARSVMLVHCASAVRTRQPVEWQETAEYPTGKVTSEVTLTPVLDETGACCQLVGIVHDLTRQKKVEEDLRASNERFLYAIKATTDALYDWNVETDTLYWGEGYEMLFGHRLRENPEPFSRWADHVLPAERLRVVGGLRHLAYETTDWHWQDEYHFRRADGSLAWVFDRGYILRDEHGRPVRMIGAMQDITERREAEQRQRLMGERLFRQNQDLQQFTYIVSHNLRAPLANALGFSQLLTQVAPDSEVFRQSLQNLHTSLRQVDDVLMDVNTILSVRDQRGGYRPEPVALAAVCREALQSLEPLLESCGGQWQCHIAEELRLPGRRAYFHSIFHNLVSNAIKYRSDDRPLRIEIGATAEEENGPTTLWVADNGRGFDLAAAGDAVFQLYQRFHSDKKGRGIGLFLVKAHVESMSGSISVESQPGVGTRFVLHFNPAGHEDLPH
ncbi:PAS domain-containing sensor histidine kinase [Hymenobacter sp. NST-14]|uniref:PAS domain-containing sensor histidine kinase n=1 Tax=Hymenobacter piscis TaxID=2839984 RepID=UPI001C02C01F|nr:PAS domain-containing sensor histidine kinase [Hymenobacter piscis]MBT9392794.1 PAS domain-containing sensor histidine kinase [Hymenobacter piscis]